MIPLDWGLLPSVQREAYKTAKLPRYYLDLGKYRKATAKNTTFTPPVNLMVALHTTLGMMQAEGLESLFARHG